MGVCVPVHIHPKMVVVHAMSCSKIRSFSAPKRYVATTTRMIRTKVNMRNSNSMFRTMALQMPSFTQQIQIKSFTTVRPPKESTGFTGLPVEPNWKQELITVYKQLLRDVELLPENTVWRQMYEKLTRYRLQIVEQEDDWLKVEELIKGGSVEQLLHQAKKDLECIPHLLQLKPWDYDRDTHAVPIIQLPEKDE